MAGTRSEPTIDLDALSALGIFRGLAAETIQQLAATLHRKSIPPHSTLMTADQTGEAVYIILSGTAKVHIEQQNGADVLVAVVGPGEVVGEMSLLDGRSRSASVVALDEIDCLWMDRESFRRAMETIPGLVFNLSRLMAARVRLANEHIQALAAYSVEGRVARQVLAFAQKYGRPRPDGAVVIPIRLTQSDLSNLIGASREQTNKVMVAYRTRGYLSADANYHITVLKPDVLANRADA